MTLDVLAVHGAALIEDAGRPGHASSGLSTSGAFDRTALQQAHRLVGNHPSAAAIEVTGGVELRSDTPILGAITGAAGPASVDGDPVPTGRAIYLASGSVLRLGTPAAGLRYYIAVRGGIDVPPVLGSRSADTIAGLGPPALAGGQRLPVGDSHGTPPGHDVPTGIVSTSLDVVLGPRDDWFTASSVTALLTRTWRITGSADRIGMRLDGPRLDRAVPDELASEPCVRGSIQVDHSGQPIVLGPDHPVTGGYPVIGVIGNCDALAQLAPGHTVRFSRRAAP